MKLYLYLCSLKIDFIKILVDYLIAIKGESNNDKSEINFSEDMDIRKKAFILKKKIHLNDLEKKKMTSNTIRMNSTQENKISIDDSKMVIEETSSKNLIMNQ